MSEKITLPLVPALVNHTVLVPVQTIHMISPSCPTVDKQSYPQPTGCVWAVDYLIGFRPSTVETLASTLRRERCSHHGIAARRTSAR